MKILHCADLHLDSKMTANLDKEKAKERKAEILTTFVRMVEYAKEHKIEAVLIAGDLFDTATVSATAGKAVYQAIVNHPDITFYYLKGNHDAKGFMDNPEEIPENLKMFGRDWKSYETGTENTIVITGVELDKENIRSVYHALSLDVTKFNIVMLHGQENTYQAKDKAECVALNELRNKGIDYLALGHVHAYKKEKLDSRGEYCYCGCLEGRGFDECGPHGFVILNIDEKTKTYEHEFVPFAGRTLHCVYADITGCNSTTDIVKVVKDELEKERPEESSLVKLILKGSVDIQCEKDMDFLKKQLEEEFYFLKIYDESKLMVDYGVYSHDVSLKGEFVRTVQGKTDLSEEEKAAIISCGIRLLTGEE